MKFENADFEIIKFKIGNIIYDILIPIGKISCWTLSLSNAIGPMLRDEIKRELPQNKQFLAIIFSFILENLGHFFKIDKAIYIKHYGFSTCLFDEDEILQIINNLNDLKIKFPNHAIIIRSIPKNYIYNLQHEFKPIISRLIWQIDDVKNKWLKRTDVKNDLEILKKFNLKHVVYDETIEDEKLNECINLYEKLYIEKYSKFNPKININYLKFLLKEKIISLHCLEKENKILAFCTIYISGNQITSPMLGYKECEIPLYRAIMAIVPLVAIEKNLKLNFSGGAGNFKKNRGGQPNIEYYLIIDDHLSIWRRLSYSFFKFIINGFEGSLKSILK